MSFDIVAIEKTLHDWAAGVTGRQVIFENEKGPRALGPHVTLLVSPATRVGRDAHLARDQAPDEGEDVWDRVEAHRLLSVSVNVHRSPKEDDPPGPGRVEDDAARLATSVSHARWQDFLAAGCLGFVSMSEIRDFSQVVKPGAGWEQRRQFDVVFSTAFVSEEQIERIDSIEIQSTLTGPIPVSVQGVTP